MNRDYDAMVAGYLCFDVMPAFPETAGQVLPAGSIVPVEGAQMSAGGPVSNTGVALRVLGHRVCFGARIGDDEFGRLAQDRLRISGNTDGLRVVESGVSSYTIILAMPGAAPIFLHNPGTNNEFGAEDLKKHLIGQCRQFHFGYAPLMRRMYENEGEELRRVLRLARDAGATTSCDMVLPELDSDAGRAPWEEILRKALPYVDMFLPSVEEALFMLEPRTFARLAARGGSGEVLEQVTSADCQRLSERAMEMGAKMVGLKCGHRGWYFQSGPREVLKNLGAAKPGDVVNWSQRQVWIPALQPPAVVSLAGTGDASVAGFLAGFLRGLSLEESLRCATCVAWQVIQVREAGRGVRSWQETDDLLKQDLPLIDPQIAQAGWRFEAKQGLYLGPKDSGAVALGVEVAVRSAGAARETASRT